MVSEKVTIVSVKLNSPSSSGDTELLNLVVSSLGLANEIVDSGDGSFEGPAEQKVKDRRQFYRNQQRRNRERKLLRTTSSWCREFDETRGKEGTCRDCFPKIVNFPFGRC